MSRRTRRADEQQPAPARPTIVSNNPIFFREDGCTEADPLHALVQHDDVPAAVVKPLPLPPSRTALPSAGSGWAGSALVMSRHGSCWVLRREPRDDPFLAAYVACAKSGGGMADAATAPANRQRGEQKKDKNRGGTFPLCGIWSGWAVGARFAGAMSCKYVCGVVDGRPSAAATPAQASPVPRLPLSRQLVVIPAKTRALARGRAQG